MTLLRASLFALSPTFLSLTWSQTTFEYWHGHSGTPEVVLNELVDAFHTSQGDYRVVPRYVGNYAESAIRLVGALAGGTPPGLYAAEVTVFSCLAKEGSLLEQALGSVLAALKARSWSPTTRLWNSVF